MTTKKNTEANGEKNKTENTPKEAPVNNLDEETKSFAQRIAKDMGKSGGTAPAAENRSDNLIKDLQTKIEELNDKLLRAVAETENVRRRSKEEIEKAKNYSISGFTEELVQVLEHLFRASDSVPEEKTKENELLKAIKDGVEMTKREFIAVLERQGVKRIYPVGEKFDHNYQQAISQIEDETKEVGTVIQVIQAGYTLKERLIKPALVVVSKGKIPANNS